MIGKLSKGSGARGLADYLLAEKDNDGRVRPEVRVIGGTIVGDSARQLAAQYRPWRDLKPDLVDPILHESLRVPDDERDLTVDEWRQIGEAWAEGMGAAAYTIIGHGDHVHVMASRVRADGRAISTWMDYRKSEQLVRDIEKQHGLQRVEASHLLEPAKAVEHQRAPTREQIRLNERTGDVAPSLIVQEAVDNALNDAPTVSEFISRLEDSGIDVKANVASTGRVNGLSYQIDNVKVTSKSLGRGYTWKSLQERGLDYEPSRDLETLRERAGAAAARRATESASAVTEDDRPNASVAVGASEPASEHSDRDQRTDRDAAAASDELAGRHGQPDRTGDSEHRPCGPEYAGDDQASSGATHGNVEFSDGDGDTARSENADAARPAVEPARGYGDTDRASDPEHRPYQRRFTTDAGDDADRDRPSLNADNVGIDDSRESTEDTQSRTQSERKSAGEAGTGHGADRKDASKSRHPDNNRGNHFNTDTDSNTLADARTDSSVDRVVAMSGGATQKTKQAVDRWLDALPADTYEVGVGKHSGGDMQRRIWTDEELRRSLGWLARENSRGADIYARPNTTRYVLVDDLTRENVEKLRHGGAEPAVVTETSPGNHQAWVDLGKHQPKEIATAVAAGLARDCEGDQGAASWRQFGRLPGYTNRKPQHAQQRNGRWQQPFVVVREAAQRVATRAQILVDKVHNYLQQREAEREQARRRQAVDNAPADPSPGQSQGATEAFQSAFKAVEGKAEGDLSRADYMAAQRLIVRDYDHGQVADAIRDASPALSDRHYAPDDYAERTARKAAESRWVAERLSEREQERRQERRQGMSM